MFGLSLPLSAGQLQEERRRNQWERAAITAEAQRAHRLIAETLERIADTRRELDTLIARYGLDA